MKIRVLIIHNDPNFCADIKTAFCEATMIVDTAFSPSEAIDLFLHYDHDLILFDTDTDVKEIIKPLRAITSVPIIALCGPNSSKERCAMLRNGASVCLGSILQNTLMIIPMMLSIISTNTRFERTMIKMVAG